MAAAGVGIRMGGGMGALVGGSLGAMLPALIGMLGARPPDGSTSGMYQLVNSTDDRGIGDVTHSWVSRGPDQPISEEQVRQLLTEEQLAHLAATFGLSPDDVAKAAAILPDVVRTLTPDGTIPRVIRRLRRVQIASVPVSSWHVCTPRSSAAEVPARSSAQLRVVTAGARTAP